VTGCIVYVYDDKLSAVTSQFIEILEYDAFCEILDLKVATSLGPNEFGANLTLPNPPEPIVILVDDTSGYFAPISLGYLNGRETARLDVTLYALPQWSEGRGGRGGPRRRGGLQPPPRFREPRDAEVLSTAAISRQINQQVESNNWSDFEALAVQSLAETAVRAMNWSKLNSVMEEKVSRWLQRLESLGITITTRVQFESLGRRDSPSREAYANREPVYGRSGYGVPQERRYDYERNDYGSRPNSDYPYGREQYRGRGPRGYRRSDERIHEDVNDRLSDDYYLDASDIEVVVADGELTLVGRVNSRADKRRAEDIAESVAGVTNVENRLRVKRSMSEGYRSTEYTGTTSTMGTGTSSAIGSGTSSAIGTASAAADSGSTQTTGTTRTGRTRSKLY